MLNNTTKYAGQDGIYNAKLARYGSAKGNGSTDDRAAIQTAIDLAYAAGGAAVYLPPGTFIVTGTGTAAQGCLRLKSNVALIGSGIGKTIIKLQNASSNNITGILRTPSAERTTNVYVSDLTIDGNRDNTTGTVIGQYCGVSPSAKITGITRSSTTATATVGSAGDRPANGSTVYIFKKEDGAIPSEYLGEFTVTGTPSGTTFTFTVSGSPGNITETIWFYNSTLTNSRDENIVFERVEVKECSDYGFDPHERTLGLKLINCISHDNGKDGFVADYLEDSYFINPVSYNNDRHGINVTTGSDNLTIDNPTCYNNGAVSSGSGIVAQRGSEDFPFPNKINIIGGSSYNNNRNGLLIQMANRVKAIGLDAAKNGWSGIRRLGCRDGVFIGNTLVDNSQTTNNTYSEMYTAEYDDSGGASATIYGSLRNTAVGNDARSTLTNKAKYSFEEVDDSSDYNIYSDNQTSGAVTGDYSIPSGNFNSIYGYSSRAFRTYLTNHYYYPVTTAGALSTKVMTLGRMYYVGPFVAENNVTINRLGVRVGTGTGNVGDTAILGIYTSENGLPAKLVGTNNAEVAINANADVEATVSISLVAGRRYWMVINCEAAVTLASFASTNNVRDSSSSVAPDSVATIIKDTVAYAATLPATSDAAAGDHVAEAAPFMWFRKV
jgi:hypothetical protein